MSESGGSVHVEREERAEGRVVRIIIERPRLLNVLDTPLMERLLSAFEGLADDESLRAVVLTGAGDRAFIGGADLREMAALDADAAERFITLLHRVCASIRGCPVPVIARIQGYCLGAGLEVAASCDLRIASLDSTFGMPEVQVGIPSVIEAALLPSLIGWGKTRELLYTGASIDAAEAQRGGLVERAVPGDQLDAAVEAWLTSILAAGPAAIRRQKALIRQWETLPLPDAIEAGVAAFRQSFEGQAAEEPRKRMRAFLERPRPGERV
ncbi:MAG: enoyl-CoA hydratase [Dehalococcoidia bacterium]|nr:enoyl-CoA hydratase [Dehalococcoidia bacterium]